MMAQFLTKYGVSVIDAWGQPFDPAIHEAVGVVPDPSVAPGTVFRVEQKGYRLNEKLLRPARVLVTPMT
jgi:molecular chaperone GrpE